MSQAKSRSSYWDNVKAMLIYLVVFAHFLIILRDNTESQLVHALYYFIYSFHMPAFVMVSGYFAKSYSEKQIDVNKLIGLFLGFYVFKILLWIVWCISTGHLSNFIFFDEAGAPWYLICLFWWFLLLPIFSSIGRTKAITVSILLMLLISLDASANCFLSMLKMINFLPFFIIGFYYSPKKNPDKTARIAGLSFLAAMFALYYCFFDYITPYESFIYGGGLYTSMGLNCIHGFFYKTIWFIIALLLSFSLFSVAPSGKHLFTKAGTNSLGIYIFHLTLRPFLIPLWGNGSLLNTNGYTIIISVAVISLLITALFSLDIFTSLSNKVLRRRYIKP